MLHLLLSSVLALSTFTSHPVTDDDKLAKKARKIHQRILCLDTHADAPIMMQKPGFDVGVGVEAENTLMDFTGFFGQFIIIGNGVAREGTQGEH